LKEEPSLTVAEEKPEDKKLQCFNCKGYGHVKSECPKKPTPDKAGEQRWENHLSKFIAEEEKERKEKLMEVDVRKKRKKEKKEKKVREKTKKT